MSELKGKTALITGSAKRLGKACALALAQKGVNIVVHYNKSEDEARENVELIKNIGVNAWMVQADLGDLGQLECFMNEVNAAAGKIDILINNASIFPLSNISSFTFNELTESIKQNAYAPLDLCRQLVIQNDKGMIVNFLDTRVWGYDWSHTAYHSSKTLLELFTRMAAIEYAPDFRVNAVAPGLVLPPDGKDISYLESLKDKLPLKRYGSEKDITDAVIYLLESDFITGQVIFVDGGRHLKEY
jgi:pteridine reductase